MKDIIVKKSKIDKKGVFANRDFKEGEIVLKWKPKILTKKQANELTLNDKNYLFIENNKYYLLQSPEKFVNHSCEANTQVNNFSDVATRKIKKGEEITSCYPNKDIKDFKCKCGSKKCLVLKNRE